MAIILAERFAFGRASSSSLAASDPPCRWPLESHPAPDWDAVVKPLVQPSDAASNPEALPLALSLN
jgi:hypothetical protein